MKKYVVFITLLLASVIINGQESKPKISVPNDNFDFGDITEGQIVDHSFTIYNTGEKTLEIQRVRASCGCTAAKPDKDKLEPGDSTYLKVSFNSTRRMGKQRKYVYVFSNDPEVPQMRVAFTANVKAKDMGFNKPETGPKLLLTSTQHNFGKVKEGEVVSYQVRFKNTGNAELDISRVKSSCGCTATVLSKKELKPGEIGTLDIKLDTSGREGQFVRTVTLYSNDSHNPNQTITLYVNIVDRNS